MTDINIPSQEIIPVDQLKVDDKNPNKMTRDKFLALKENFKKYGFIVPVITNKDLLIADGEHRWRAAKELGMKQIPVIRLEVTDVDRRMLRQILNKLRGEHDPAMDVEEFKFFLDQNVFEDIEILLGARQGEIMRMLEGEEDDDTGAADVEELLSQSIKPRIKLGEVWKMGKHYIMCGDSTKKEVWAKLMKGDKANAIVTDPPYNLAFNTTKKGRFEVFANDNLDQDVFRDVIQAAAENADEYLEKNASIYYCIDWRSYDTLKRELEKLYELRACIVWVKEFGGLGWHYRFRHEFVVYGTKGSDPIFNNQGIAEDVWELKSSNQGPKFHLSNQGVYVETPKGQYIRLSKIDEPTKRSKVFKYEEPSVVFSTVLDEHTDVWEIASLNSFQSRAREDFPGWTHPTIKPLTLICRALKHSTYPGHIIIDGFLGSGSTLIGCEKTNRECRGIELDPVYCEVAMRRWEKMTGGKPEKVEEAN